MKPLSQGASEVQDSAVLSTTARASGLHNGRGRRQALGLGLTGGAPRGQGLLVVTAGEHHPVEGLARQAQELSSGSGHRNFEHKELGARVRAACRGKKVRVGKKSLVYFTLPIR